MTTTLRKLLAATHAALEEADALDEVAITAGGPEAARLRTPTMTTALKALLEAAAATYGTWEIEQADATPDGFIRDEAKPVLSVFLYNSAIAVREIAGEEPTKELTLVLPSVVPADLDIDYGDIFAEMLAEDSVEGTVYLSVEINRNGLEGEVSGHIAFATEESECRACDGRGTVRGRGSYGDGGDPPDEDCEECDGVGFYRAQSAEVELELEPAPKLNPKTGEWLHSKTSDYKWKVTEHSAHRRR